jgi:multidrug resistance efflux pump
MVIVLVTYLALAWVVFSKFKLVKWGWLSGTVTVLIGVFILAVFLAMFNYLTPSGSFVIVSRVVEVTPNVSGRVTAIPVQPNVPVKAGAVLFQIERAPYEYKVDQLQAALAEARQKVEQLKSNVELAGADAEAIASQLAYATKNRDAQVQLVQVNSAAKLAAEQAIAQVDMYTAQLVAARARETNAKLALGSVIDGENTTVAQLVAQLDNAKWELDQTTVLAPDDGYVSTMAVAVGARALPARSLMSFIVTDDIAIVGMFPPNGFQTIKQGAKVSLVFGDLPGRTFGATIADIPRGVGQGQIAVSGVLARAGSIGGANAYPALISIPKEIPREQLRVGMPGTATVFADNAGPIGLLMSILVWISSYTAYL